MVRVAAAADVTESTISRFEKGRTRGFPNDPDRIVSAYASECSTTPLAIWTAAVERWQQAENDETPLPRSVRGGA